jgi:hypothetical protein
MHGCISKESFINSFLHINLSMATLVRTSLPPSGIPYSPTVRRELEKFAFFTMEPPQIPFAFVGHTVNDVDGVGASYGLSRLFSRSTVAFQDLPRKAALDLYRRLGHKVEDPCHDLLFVSNLPPSTGIILCDGCSKYRFRYVKGRPVLAIIDHHKSEPGDFEAPIAIISPQAPAACALVYEIYQMLNYVPDASIALALQVGILGDASMHVDRMERSRPMLEALRYLSGVSLPDALDMVNPKLSMQEELDVRKAFAQTRLVRVELALPAGVISKRLIALTVSNEESLAPLIADDLVYTVQPNLRGLVPLGQSIDAAVVLCRAPRFPEEGEDTRFSIRFNSDLSDLGFSAHEYAHNLASYLKSLGSNASGGGNIKVAGVSTAMSVSEALIIAEKMLRIYFERGEDSVS